ncbi:sodium:solute symporter family protein [Planococcus sp. CPCC 101016]|uniref:sodium:solute symporter family protein n=1 Tax=Planococcus sp. CPCC 101016 TaxID=2599617 RepID=UPI0011B3FEFD|nr:sodium:solute symporter family protein [Planococcus sp. CPCC 101016]TWT07052.1 sodium:solute symporter family protein [Planococcus sp. CPCC 101016]
MVENQGVYIGVFIAVTALMILVGVWASRKVKSGDDFLMGGRNLPLPLLIGTTVATLVGTGSSMGAVGFAYSNGWAGALYGLGGSIGIFALLLLFANVRKYNFTTFSEELSFYFGESKLFRGVTAILLYLAAVGWLGAHIMGGSLYLSWITGMDLFTAKIVTALGFAVYTMIGGYLAVVYTDTIQGFILFSGFIMLAVLSLFKVGGYETMSARIPNEMVSFLGVEVLGIIPAISLIVVIAIGVLAAPSYRHRIYTSKNTLTLKKALVISGILFACFSLFPSIIGMATQIMNPDLEPGYAFPYLATEVFPVWVGAIILTAGLSATMSSGSSDFIAGVTILVTDVYQVALGKAVPREKLKMYSRIALLVTLTLAFVGTMGATNIISYITNFISTIMAGLFAAAVIGKFWPRATWQGGLACLLGGSITSFIVLSSTSLMELFGNPVLPALTVAFLAGIIVSLVTPASIVTKEESLKRLEKKREREQAVAVDPLTGVEK